MPPAKKVATSTSVATASVSKRLTSTTAMGAKKAATTKPAAKKAGTAKPASKKVASAKPAGKKASARPVAKKAGTAKPAGKKVASAKPAGKKASARPVAKKAATAKPATKKVAVAKKTVKKASDTKTTAQRPVAKKASAPKPSAPKSSAKKSTMAKQPAAGVAKANPKPAFDAKFLEAQRVLLDIERATYTKQAASLQAEADSLAEQREPGDVQFDEESGNGDTLQVERERDLALSARARFEVEEINRALAKIEAGTYGICEISGEPIPRARLQAIPQCRERVEFKVGGFGRR